MQTNGGMFFQEGLDFGRFVRGQVIQDDVDFLLRFASAHDLIQKADELLAGVPYRGLALNLTGAHIECCV